MPAEQQTTILEGRITGGREIRRVIRQTEVNFVCAGRGETDDSKSHNILSTARIPQALCVALSNREQMRKRLSKRRQHSLYL